MPPDATNHCARDPSFTPACAACSVVLDPLNVYRLVGAFLRVGGMRC